MVDYQYYIGPKFSVVSTSRRKAKLSQKYLPQQGTKTSAPHHNEALALLEVKIPVMYASKISNVLMNHLYSLGGGLDMVAWLFNWV
jgi:hypothetical protein